MVSGAAAVGARTFDRVAANAVGATVLEPEPLRRAPVVSVVIPCYNYGRFLPDAVASVLGQEEVHVEVIVLDDASTDDSVNVARLLAEKDSRVHLVEHPENKGHIATYNEGLDRANGEYLVLLSADDMLTPGSLARAVALLENNPRVGFAYGGVLEIASAEGLPSASTSCRGWAIWPGALWLHRRFETSRNVIRTCEVVMRTEVQRRIGGYRPELPQLGDLDMWMRAAAVADVGYTLGCDQAYYRLHGGNMHQTLHNGREVEGILRDLQERFETFELLEPSAGSNGALSRTKVELAREALTYATRAYAFNMTQHEIADGLKPFLKQLPSSPRPATRDFTSVDTLVEFACSLEEPTENMREWHTLQRIRERRSRGRSTPAYLAADIAARAARKISWWPWKRLGS